MRGQMSFVSRIRGLNAWLKQNIAQSNAAGVSVKDDVAFSLLLQASTNLMAMLAVNVSAAIAATVLLMRNGSGLAPYWFGVVVAITLVRGLAWRRLFHRLKHNPPTDDQRRKFTRNWTLFYTSGLIVSAFTWIFILDHALSVSDEARFMVAIVISALAGGATGVTSAIKTGGRLYITALLLPSAFVLFNTSDSGSLLATLAVIFWIVMLIGHTNNHKILMRTLDLQRDNASLINDLTSLNTSLEQKVAERTLDLEYAALRDPLTDLPNRRGFRDALEMQLTRAQKDGARLAVGVIDLDGFKPINDAFGHATGDQLLIEVGERLQNVIGDTRFVARLGGDEFGIIITQFEDYNELENIGSQICRKLAEPYNLTGVVAEIGASIGICKFPCDADTTNDLCEKADYALYHAKQAQKGTAVVFNAQHAAEIRELASMEQVLRRANFEDELYVVFQPIVHVGQSRTYGFEALARWNSPVLGNIPPNLFIRAAERSGIIVDVTRHLLRKSLKAASAWPKDLRLSVNLSARDIASMETVNTLIDIVLSSPVEPHRIDFEITETALVCDFDQAREALDALNRIGSRIALDDFGTGHSSLSHIRLLPFDKLKVDSSFVAEVVTHRPSEDIVRTLIRLCESMRIDCIVEGVETADQMQKVVELGATLLQGFHLARPMEVSSVAPYLLAEQANAAHRRALVPASNDSRRSA